MNPSSITHIKTIEIIYRKRCLHIHNVKFCTVSYVLYNNNQAIITDVTDVKDVITKERILYIRANW